MVNQLREQCTGTLKCEEKFVILFIINIKVAFQKIPFGENFTENLYSSRIVTYSLSFQ